MISASTLTTGKIFQKVTKKLGFSGSGVTRYKEYDDYYLFVNHQKSNFGKSFYINVAILFKEMLGRRLTEEEAKKMWKLESVWPHVSARIESIPGNLSNLQDILDRLVKEDKILELEPILTTAISNAIFFAEKNHTRTAIRKLESERKFHALILKEV